MACTNTSCNSTRPTFYPCFQNDDTFIKGIRLLAYCTIMAISLVGNALVIGVLRQDRKMRRMNYFIGNIALVDLIISAVYMPRMVSVVTIGYEWLVSGTAGLILCKIVPFLHHVSILVSILTLVALSFERYLAVATLWPRRILSHQRTKVIIILIWIVSVGVRLPHVVALTLVKGRGGGYICVASLNELFGSSKARKLYNNFLAITFYAVPLALIIILYSLAMLKLKRRTFSADNTRDTQRSQLKQKMNRSLFRMMLAVTVVFILCWVSYFVLRKAILNTKISCDMQFLRSFLAHTNCALTPCIYAIFSKKYRRGFRDIIRRLCCCFSNRTPQNDVSAVINGTKDYSLSRSVSDGIILKRIISTESP